VPIFAAGLEFGWRLWGWSTRPRYAACRDGGSINRHSSAETRPVRAQYIRRSYWYSMLKIPDVGQFAQEAPSGGSEQTGMGSPRQEPGFIGLHQAGPATPQRRFLRTSADADGGRLGRRIKSGQSGREMIGHACGGDLGGVPSNICRLDRQHCQRWRLPPQQAAAPARGGAQICHHDGNGARQHLTARAISTIKRSRRYNALGPVFGSTEYSTRRDPDPRSQDQHRHDRQGSRVRDADILNRSGPVTPPMKPIAPRLLGQMSRSGATGSNNHNSMFAIRAGSAHGGHTRCGRSRRLTRRAPTSLRPSSFTRTEPSAKSECSIRRREIHFS